MIDPELRLTTDEFPLASEDQWRARVESQLPAGASYESLVTRTCEGIDLRPLYTRRDEPAELTWPGLPGRPPFVRGADTDRATGTSWELRQEHTHPDLQQTNRFIRQDVQGGVTSLRLKLDAAARTGLDPDDPRAARQSARAGVAAYHRHDLQIALEGVDLSSVAVVLDSGAAFLPAASQLVAHWHERGLAAHEPRGAFGADPLGALAREAELPYSITAGLQMLGEMARWTDQHCPQVTAVAVDTSAYHRAGANEAQDLAIALSTGVAYLRAMEQQGLVIDAAARQIRFRMSVDAQVFLSAAKLRAARWLWWQVVRACGGTPSAGAMRLEVRTSERVLSRVDPHLNLVRNLIAMTGGVIGGSDALSSVPFDVLLGEPDELSRRLARNTLWILQHEAQLGRVVDPAGGSWYLEQLTHQLAQRAWKLFQDIERRGGIVSALTSGRIAQQIESASALRDEQHAQRRPTFDDPAAVEQAAFERPRTSLDAEAIRCAASQRLEAVRQTTVPSFVGAADRMKVAVAAALAGASLGQLANALEFRSETTTIPNLSEEVADPPESPVGLSTGRPRS
jgi:methylmalonyl-CoA mutase